MIFSFYNRFKFEKRILDFKEFVLLLRYDMNVSSNYYSLFLEIFSEIAKKLRVIYRLWIEGIAKSKSNKIESNGNCDNLIDYFEFGKSQVFVAILEID